MTLSAFERIFNACTDSPSFKPSYIITDTATYWFYLPYLGRRGPRKFSGSPASVARQMRAYQKGVSVRYHP